MTTPAGLRPVSRPRALIGGLLLLAVLTGVVMLVEYLRHPPAVAPVAELPDASDPRDEIECPPAPSVGGADERPVPVNSNDLYDCPHTYDGRPVRFEGEVVGALLDRADGAWTQLNDDAYAGDLGPLPAHREFRGGNAGVGVHLPRDLADAVEWVGGPAARGDVLVVTGPYHQSDADSGEAAVIRASAGEVIATGSPIEDRVMPDRRVAGIILAVAAMALLGAGRRWSVKR